MPTRVLVPSGVLGLGFDRDALRRGIESSPDIICIDGGSTDSGPFYLGEGVSKYPRASTAAEWKQLLDARAEADVPLVIGSSGTCGTDSMVDWMFEITNEIARAQGRKVKVATVKSSQKTGFIAEAFGEGRVEALDPAIPLTETDIVNCSNIVALAGAEQIGAAIETGAEIVLAGRATDTASIASLPLIRGDDAGAAWHGAKIAECGALCSTKPLSGVVVVEFGKSEFSVEPMADGARCTPSTVSAHMLYENADPFILHEPGGCLDATDARYSAIDERKVAVKGSRWIQSDCYAVKLEGAGIAGYQTTILAIVRDSRYVENIGAWSSDLQEFLSETISERTLLGPDDYRLEIRLIGIDSALGRLETKPSAPAEVGALAIVTARTQDEA
ncbi:MAG: acyclic terpene utilization AtuA family protein, partial [Albidovulum sp.]|nr:acyclic terpene utilization AtuA family protein [Albidovulum sp.]